MIGQLKRFIVQLQNRAFARRKGLNSRAYWDARFHSNWVNCGGRLQTTLFAVGFVMNLPQAIAPESILDYGCGFGDSLPVLKMRFPATSLLFHDFSEIAMKEASARYGDIAIPVFQPKPRSADLVYCSNVIEHVQDPDEFLKVLVEKARRYIVVQCPYEERWDDGAPLTSVRPRGEHQHTITASLVESVSCVAKWSLLTFDVPHAWPWSPQALFIGTVY